MGRNRWDFLSLLVTAFLSLLCTAPWESYLQRPYLGCVWACCWYRSRSWSMWCINDSIIWSLVCMTWISLCIWCMGVYINLHKQMSFMYMTVRVVGYMIRYILVPVLIADPRATVILLTYMCAYLDRWKYIIICWQPASHVGYTHLCIQPTYHTHMRYIFQFKVIHHSRLYVSFQKIWSFK